MRFSLLLFAGFTSVAFSGCEDPGEPTASVTGTLTCGEAPLAGAAVTFYGPGGNPIKTVMVDSEGAYDARVALGLNRVTVQIESTIKSDPSLTQFEGGIDPRAAATTNSLPPQYSDYASTPLSCEVKGGADNRFDIAIP